MAEKSSKPKKVYVQSCPVDISCGSFRGLRRSLSNQGHERKKKEKELLENMERLMICDCLKKKSRMQVQYDSTSYLLNFDDGIEKDDDALPSFSTRYANPQSHEGWRVGQGSTKK